MPPTLLIIAYCVMIVAASLLGGLLPSMIRLTHLRMQLIMSLVSGLMLGVALVHMLPHAAMHGKSFLPVGYSMLAGVMMMFFLLRVFHVHHHVDPDHSRCDHDHTEDVLHAHTHDTEHHHSGKPTASDPTSGFSWQALFVGLAVHTLIDGAALAASVKSESRDPGLIWGLGTFLAVVLHKPLDAMSITALIRARNGSIENQMLANCGFALACPLGAFLAWSSLFAIADTEIAGLLLACTLGFSAGFFLCIALGDLLPEVQFHSHDRGKLTLALLAGVLVAVVIELLHSH